MTRIVFKIGIPFTFIMLFLTACMNSPSEWIPKPCRKQNLSSSSNPVDLQRKSAIAPVMIYPDTDEPGLRAQGSNNMPLLLAHYLPWFQNPETSGYWGNHWTMNTCNPEQMDSQGRRQICSHYYPIIGPYDSSDPDLLEYHMLLMRLSGVDGILIDWYGTQPYYDWPVLKEATDKIMFAFNARGFKVGIVYEDRTIKAALDKSLIDDGILAAQQDINYLQEHYFPLKNYLHIDETPLLLNFGPSHFTAGSQWQDIFQVSDTPPHYSGLSYLCGASYTNYPWIEFPDNPDYLRKYYAWIDWAQLPYSIGSAYPGLHDYYAQGGWGENLYFLNDDKGERFAKTLALNLDFSPDIIQLNTWNDWGEGTMLEPSREYGYGFLQDLQTFKSLPFNTSDLELATQLYSLRKQHKENLPFQHQLDHVADVLFIGQTQEARGLLLSYSHFLIK